MENKVKGKKEMNSKMRTLFLLFFPSVLIAVAGIMIKEQLIVTAVSLLLVFYQFVVLKNFIDTYYGVEND